MKKLYGIGTGPGDPELLTLKAVRMIEEADIIFAPQSRGKNMAVDTAKEFIGGKKIIFIDLPMGRVKEEDYIRAAEIIDENIPKDGIGVYLTIGDPLIYSSFIYIREKLKEGIDVEIVPGIPSFLAGASISQEALTVRGDTFILCDQMQEDYLDKTDSIAILKTSKGKEKILNLLEEKNFKYKYIKKATLEDEEILSDRDKILEDRNYMSLILGRKDK